MLVSERLNSRLSASETRRSQHTLPHGDAPRRPNKHLSAHLGAPARRGWEPRCNAAAGAV